MIIPTLAKILVKEHIHKPIQGRVLCLGRQTVQMTHQEAIKLIQNEGYIIPAERIKETSELQDKSTRVGKGKQYISDIAFFKLLGIDDMESMDISEYEHATIIHDLNKPVPKNLEDKYDFIVDGGTFDHLFDLKTVFMNVNKMLKKDGRVFQWNAASNFTGAAYLSFGPDLFLDYFLLNRFADCKVWLAELKDRGQPSKWNFYELEMVSDYYRLRSKHYLLTVVLAEKCPNTTWNKIPTQSHYRDQELWADYHASKKNVLASPRKTLKGHKRFSFLGETMGSILRRITGQEFLIHRGYIYI